MEITTEQAKLENEVEDVVSPESASESETENLPLFQAIGTLYGLPERDEGGNFSLSIGGQRYHLFIPSDRYRAWLTQFEKQPEKPLYLRVYPKYLNISNQALLNQLQIKRE